MRKKKDVKEITSAYVHLHSVAILSAFLVISDGQLDFEEWCALEPLIEHQDFDRDEFIPAVEVYVHELESKGPKHVKSLLHRSGYGLDSERVDGLFEDFIDIVLSNNDIDTGEIDILIHIRKILRIPEEDFLVRILDKVVQKSLTSDLTLSFVEHSKKLF